MDTNKKPLIIISNDDGFRAKGINFLIDSLRDMGRLLVCAPDGARSGYSCAFSADTPLRLTLQRRDNDLEIWSANGTPVDCVKLAFDCLCHGERPAMVIGGINHGDNASINSHYSGTMGVTKEGCLKHVPSVAFSICTHDSDADFSPLRPYLREITARVLKEGLPQGLCLNVNFPVMEKFKGVRVCRMATGQWQNECETMRHPRGHEYYWLVGNYTNEEPQADDTDNYALTHGYVAITPTTIDVTHYEALRCMNDWQYDN